jgi:hypothetical protein
MARLVSLLLFASLTSAALARASRVSALPPGKLLAGYATECNETVSLERAREGVNVFYWFSISLAYNESTKSPTVSYGAPDLDCIARVSAALRAENLPTAHLLTVGGWDAPHPDTRASPTAAYAEWTRWNSEVLAKHAFSFDGIDWDLEGNDNATSPFNTFTIDVLNYVGVFSTLAKADGYIVSMVPPESYLDPWTAPGFDRSLLHAYPDNWQPEFTYHGLNVYAYLLARWPDAFDLVLVQTYETFSHLDFAVQAGGAPPAEYLRTLIPMLKNGFWVNFGGDKALGFPSARVSVPAHKLLIGFGNAWTKAAPGTPPNATRNTLVMPSEIGDAFGALERDDPASVPRGVFYWVLSSEGDVPAGEKAPLFFGRDVNAWLKARD